MFFTGQISMISDSLKPTSVSRCALSPLPSPRSRVHHLLQRIFIYNAKKKLEIIFWMASISVKQLVKNGATPLQEVLVCVDLLGTTCMAQEAGVCPEESFSLAPSWPSPWPWGPE